MKVYISRDSKPRAGETNHANSFVYHYDLWLEQSRCFRRMTQTFERFPTLETNWNTLDHTISGFLDAEEMYGARRVIKFRRVSLVIIASDMNWSTV